MFKWLDEHLVPEWRDSWRWFSVQSTALAGTAAATIAAYPDLLVMLASFLGGTPRLQALVAAFVIIVIALRLWNQGVEDEQD